MFQKYLEQEYSSENLEFCLVCDEYKKLHSSLQPIKAREIYDTFVSCQASKEVEFNVSFDPYETNENNGQFFCLQNLNKCNFTSGEIQ